TCGRCKVNLNNIVTKLEKKISHSTNTLTIAVMGCMVNGPGEAREADIGVAFDKNYGVLFKKGKIIAKYSDKIIIEKLLEEIKNE
ncbi:MAG TPA: flavodoxin-dependent (E)-4-hydroxy-3-methylbut-2-enyl-diphosphate synthase, partial [Candidatus Paceibacterota bacterium]|nr:flavodoxin-dependent (E)-4-hydroxy-3-methylbut-2-enyl-diphosphate synthase [Candidatus Paceibacterota bacterium]